MTKDCSLLSDDVLHWAVLSKCLKMLWKEKVKVKNKSHGEAYCCWGVEQPPKVPRAAPTAPEHNPLALLKNVHVRWTRFMSCRLMNTQMGSSCMSPPVALKRRLCCTFHTVISHDTSLRLHRMTIYISPSDSHHHGLYPCLKPFCWPADGNLPVKHVWVCQATLKQL